MNRTIALAAVCVLVFGLGSVVVAEARQGQDIFTRMQALEGIVPPARAESIVDGEIRLLKEEMTSPTTPHYGMGGGPIDTGYVQDVIMGFPTNYWNQPMTLKRFRSALVARLRRIPESDTAMRQRVIIMLGYAGEPCVVPSLINILRTHKDGFMRVSAVYAMRRMNKSAVLIAVPALKYAAQKDEFTRISFGSCLDRDRKMCAYYPARRAAAEVLSRLGVRLPAGTIIEKPTWEVKDAALMLDDRGVATTGIQILSKIGGPEAEKALEGFITANEGNREMRYEISCAKDALRKLREQRPSE